MKNQRSLGFSALVSFVLVLAIAGHPAFSSSVTRQQEAHLEKNAPPAEPPRVYGPPALSPGRRHAALQIFEKIHPTLTIHYNGFSRQGSLICYDMLNGLRTVDEARALMDVEFHLLDLMLEHYKVKRHMRIVDANEVKNMLDIGNIFSFKFPEIISNVTRFIKEYDPILRVFLKRYLPHIELLVIVNVPAFLAPLLPTLASRLMGIPSSNIVAIVNGSELERFMERKYIPKEFGNPTGLSVKNNDEDLTASCLMLREIKTHLGESALTSHGKKLLEEHGPRLLAPRKQAPVNASKVYQATSARASPKTDEARGATSSATGDAENFISLDEPFDDIE